MQDKIMEFEQLLSQVPMNAFSSKNIASEEEILQLPVVKDIVKDTSISENTQIDVEEDLKLNRDVIVLVQKALEHWKIQKKAPAKKKPIKAAPKPPVNNLSKKQIAKPDIKQSVKPVQNKVAAKKVIAKQTQEQSQAQSLKHSVKNKSENYNMSHTNYDAALGVYIPALPTISTKQENLTIKDKEAVKVIAETLAAHKFNEICPLDSFANGAAVGIRFMDTPVVMTSEAPKKTAGLEKFSAADMVALRQYYSDLSKAVNDITLAFNEQLELPAHIEAESVPELEVAISTNGSCARATIIKTSGLLIKDLAFKRVALSLHYPKILQGRTFTLYFAL